MFADPDHHQRHSVAVHHAIGPSAHGVKLASSLWKVLRFTLSLLSDSTQIKKGFQVDEKTWTTMMDTRTSDGRAMIMPYVVAVSALLALIVFGDVANQDSSVKLAVATFAVLGSLWTMMWWDGVVGDVSKLAKDQPEGVKGSNIGKSFDNMPFAAMRVINVVVISLIGLSQVLAIY